MTTAYLGLGSNVNAELNIRLSVMALRDRFENVSLSPIYRSRAVGFEGDDFINLVASIDTELSATELRDWLRELEDRHGRQRDVPKFSDRVLDIDILLFGRHIIETDELQVPRPEILKFAHVLKPLSDLAPSLPYPGLGTTIETLWDTSGDRHAGLELIDAGFLDCH